MDKYDIAMFFHIIGIAGIFGGIGTNLAVLHYVRRAPDVKAVLSILPIGPAAARVIQLFAILALASGAYIVEDEWNWGDAWVYVATVTFFILLALSPLVLAPRMKAAGMEAGRLGEGPIPPSLRAKLNDPVVTTVQRAMTTATIGIVYLMTIKPGTAEALIAMAIAVICGVALSARAWMGRAHADSD